MQQGSYVLIRDNAAGVFVGVLCSVQLETKCWTLTAARKIHYWQGAAAVEGIATHGVGEGSRLTPVVSEVAGCDLVQIIAVSDEAVVALKAWPEWTP